MAKARRVAKVEVTEASKRGQRAGAAVVADRMAKLRARPVAPPRRRAPKAAPPAIPARTRRALAALPASTGLLIAEGDSWFDYPFNDVLSMLEDEHGFDVESVAHMGDTVEDMAYSGGQFDAFARRLEKLLAQGRVPDAILLSGGGNDIAGDEFAILLNHAASGLETINADVVRGVVDVRLKNAYAFLIGGLTEIATRYLGRPLPIVVHGYDYPVPDGRGYAGGFSLLPGPWLQPGFRRKGYADQKKNFKTVAQLIDRFNDMLQVLSAAPEHAHVRYVNLRNTLAWDSNYKTDWANELHPTKRGFKAVAAKIALAI